MRLLRQDPRRLPRCVRGKLKTPGLISTFRTKNDDVNPETRELLALAIPSLREHAVIVLDAQGVVRGWSGGSEHVFGYAPSEIEGQSGSILFTPEDREKGLDRLELEVALSGSTGHDDRWHLRKDGTRIWTYGSVTAIWEGTVLRGFLKIVRDRTDLKMDLEAKANRLTELEAAHERTQRFLRTLGHEMRNPLGLLKNSAFILVRLSEDERVKKIAESIENQVRSLERLAEDLMDVARLEHGKVELRLDDLDVNELLKREVAAHMDQASAKGVRMETVLASRPLTARLDEDRVRQAVANLLAEVVVEDAIAAFTDVPEGDAGQVSNPGIGNKDSGTQVHATQACIFLAVEPLVQQHELHFGCDEFEGVVQHAHLLRVTSELKAELEHSSFALEHQLCGWHAAKASHDDRADRLDPKA